MGNCGAGWGLFILKKKSFHSFGNLCAGGVCRLGAAAWAYGCAWGLGREELSAFWVHMLLRFFDPISFFCLEQGAGPDDPRRSLPALNLGESQKVKTQIHAAELGDYGSWAG